MKDECQGHIMREFIGLKPKMYSFVHEKKTVQNDNELICMEEKKRAKGVSKVVVQSSIHHENYKSCLFYREFQKESMVAFRSLNHQIYTIVLNKTSLSPYDDKRHILDDGIHTLAHGHYRTRDV